MNKYQQLKIIADRKKKAAPFVHTDAEEMISDAIDNAKMRIPKDGYSPVKGVDYYTEEEINAVIKYIQSNVHDGLNGKDGKDGKNGLDGKPGKDGIDAIVDYKSIIKEVLSKIPKPTKEKPLDINNIINTVKESLPKVNYKDEIGKILATPGFRMLLHGGGLTVVTHDGTLTGDGTEENPLHAVAEETTPASPDTSVQFNDGGVFGGDDGFKYDKTIGQVQIGGEGIGSGDPNNPLAVSGDSEEYITANIQNKSSLGYTDLTLSADNDGEELIGHYIDMGIVGSEADVGEEDALEPNKGYIYTSGGGLLITTDGSAPKPLQWATNGFAKENISKILDSDGNMQISHDDRYLNFGVPLDPSYDFADGEAGYGFRNNAGNIEFKHKDKQWAIIPYLAIETTTDHFFNDLIANNLLEPQATYLLTDYLNETPIANTSPTEYHVGLQNVNGTATYLDGTLIVDGDPEQIYLTATSTNTFRAEGTSKTFPDEKVYFNVNVPSVTAEVDGNDYASEVYGIFSWGSGETTGEIPITIIDEVSFSLNLSVAQQAALDANPDIFYAECYDATTEVYMEMSSGNRGDDWDIDGNVITIYDGTSEWISNGADFTGFSINFDSYISGSFLYDHLWINDSTDLFITPESATEFSVGGDMADKLEERLTGTYFEIADNTSGGYAILDIDNYGTEWEYNPSTLVITYLGEQDFSTITLGGSIYSHIVYPTKIFSYGRIVARRNDRLNTYVEADYRSQVFRRYKVNSTAWAGTGTIGSVYSTTGNIFFCIKSTSTAPSTSSGDWILLGEDSYWMSNINMNFQGNAPQHLLVFDSGNYFDYPMFDTFIFDAMSAPLEWEITALVNNEFADIVFKTLSASTRRLQLSVNDVTIDKDVFRNNTLTLDAVVLTGNTNNENNSGLVSITWSSGVFTDNKIGTMESCLIESFSNNDINKMQGCVCRGSFQKNEIYNLNYCRFFGLTELNVIQNLVYSDFLWPGLTASSACCRNNTFSSVGYSTYSRVYFNYFSGIVSNNKFYAANFYANSFGGTVSDNEFYYTVSWNMLCNISSTSNVAQNKFYGFFQFNVGEGSIAKSEFYGTMNNNIWYNKTVRTYAKVSGGSGYTLGDTLTLVTGTTTTAWVAYKNYVEGEYVTESGNIYYCTRSHQSQSISPYNFATDLSYGLWVQQKPATVTVSGVSGGAVTAVTLANGGSLIPTGTLATTGGTGTGCTVSVSAYQSRPTFIENIFWGACSYNHFYHCDWVTNIHHAIVSSNILYNNGTANTIQNNLTYSMKNNAFWGGNFSNNYAAQKFEYNTLYAGSGMSFNSFLGYVQNVTLNAGYAIGTSICNSLGGNIGAGLTLSANIAGSLLEDTLGGGITVSADITNKLYLKASSILIGGQAARSLTVERHLTANTAGNNLTTTSGGATSGATDKNGGDNIIESGIATGTGSSNVIIKTTTAGASGTTDRNPTEKVRILGSGAVGIGTTAPNKQVEINSATGECLRLTYNDSNGSASNYADLEVSSSGDLSIKASGGDINLDNENLTTSGTIKGGGYKSSDDSSGITQTVAIKDFDEVTHTMVFKNGLLTSYTSA